jgi:hypothetical protein
MDQLKPVIEFCKKQYFWILLGVLCLTSIAGFVMTKMALAQELKTQQALIDSKYTSVQEVSGKASTHPNENSHAKMDEIVNNIAADVRKAWELQYKRQEGIMQWPKELDYQGDFIPVVEKYKPIESLPFPTTGQDALVNTVRERYRDYVDPLFPKLAKIIGAKWISSTAALGNATAASGSGGGIGAPTGMGGGIGAPSMLGGSGLGGASGGSAADGEKVIVIWPAASQQELMKSVLWWHDTKKPPSTIEILYTQEDFWILEGLMNIIKATNGDVQENFQASIKEIEFIRIGKNAVGRAGELTTLGTTGNTGMGMGMGSTGSSGMLASNDDDGDMDSNAGSSAPAPSMDGMDGMVDGSGEGGATSTAPDPASGRYVDTAFQPIQGDKIRTVVTSGAIDPTDAPLAVAKRIPVRMRFVMDQRKVNRLLAECGNADLLFEVRQVRINTTPFGSGNAMGAMMGGGSGSSGRAGPGLGGADGGMGLGPAGGGDGDEGFGGLMGGGGAPTIAGGSKSYDLPVEIYGVVYLFNPVDMNKLGLQNVTADTQIENVGRVSAEDSTNPESDASATAGSETPAQPASGTPASEPPAATSPAAETPAVPATPVQPDNSTPSGAAGDPTAPPAAATDTPSSPAVPVTDSGN